MAMFTGEANDFFRSVLSSKQYKAGQGNKARNATLFAFLALIGLGMWSWRNHYATSAEMIKWGIPIAGGVVAAWMAYRLVNYPRFADFLISTEAEMNKVSWPSKQETKAYTIVVIVNVILMAIFLFVADWFWKLLLSWIGILKIGRYLGGGSENMFHLPPLPKVLDWMTNWW